MATRITRHRLWVTALITLSGGLQGCDDNEPAVVDTEIHDALASAPIDAASNDTPIADAPVADAIPKLLIPASVLKGQLRFPHDIQPPPCDENGQRSGAELWVDSSPGMGLVKVNCDGSFTMVQKDLSQEPAAPTTLTVGLLPIRQRPAWGALPPVGPLSNYSDSSLWITRTAPMVSNNKKGIDDVGVVDVPLVRLKGKMTIPNLPRPQPLNGNCYQLYWGDSKAYVDCAGHYEIFVAPAILPPASVELLEQNDCSNPSWDDESICRVEFTPRFRSQWTQSSSDPFIASKSSDVDIVMKPAVHVSGHVKGIPGLETVCNNDWLVALGTVRLPLCHAHFDGFVSSEYAGGGVVINNKKAVYDGAQASPFDPLDPSEIELTYDLVAIKGKFYFLGKPGNGGHEEFNYFPGTLYVTFGLPYGGSRRADISNGEIEFLADRRDRKWTGSTVSTSETTSDLIPLRLSLGFSSFWSGDVSFSYDLPFAHLRLPLTSKLASWTAEMCQNVTYTSYGANWHPSHPIYANGSCVVDTILPYPNGLFFYYRGFGNTLAFLGSERTGNEIHVIPLPSFVPPVIEIDTNRVRHQVIPVLTYDGSEIDLTGIAVPPMTILPATGSSLDAELIPGQPSYYF